MIGHKWEPAEGTVINSHSEQMELPGQHGMHWVTVHDIDVRAKAGDAGRARVPSAEYSVLHPGTVVRLEINEKTGEIRLHPHRDKLIISVDRNVSASGEDFGGPAASGDPVGFPGGLAGFGGPAVTVSGPGGMDLAQLLGDSLPDVAQVVSGEDVAEILRTMQSADPAAIAASRERLRDIAQASREATRQAAADGDPVAQSRLRDRTSPSDRPSPSDRLAALEQMLERGQLTQAEFDAKRQRILDQL